MKMNVSEVREVKGSRVEPLGPTLNLKAGIKLQIWLKFKRETITRLNGTQQ